MIKNISNTLYIMMFAMFSSFMVTIILGRTLSIGDFGEFVLLKQLILIGSTVAIFGLDYSYIKVFSNNPNLDNKIHLITIATVGIFAFLFIIILKISYNYSFDKLLYLLFGICFGAINLYQAAIFRLNKHFLIAQFFSGGWKIVLLLLVIAFLYLEVVIDIILIYRLLLASLFIFSSFIISHLFKLYSAKGIYINYKNYLTFGLLFWLINSAGLISGGIDKLVIPIVFNNEVLGVFSAVSFIFVISLTMIGSAIGYVIFPRLSKGKTVNFKKITVSIILISFGSSIFFQFAGMELVSFIFSGKFNSYISPILIFCFTLIGCLQIVHTILHFILSAQGNKKQLIVYWLMTLLFIVLFVVMLLIFNPATIPVLIQLSLIIIIVRTLKIATMLLLLAKIKSNQDKYFENIPETI